MGDGCPTPCAAVVWYRDTDLRVHDHAPLSAAHAAHPAVAHVYCAPAPTAVDYSRSLPVTGWPKCGRIRARFVTECVAALGRSLAAARGGQRLLCVRGAPERVLPMLAAACGAGAPVYCHAAESTEEEQAQRAVAAALAPAHALRALWGGTLYHRDDLPFGAADFPPTASQFRARVEAGCRPRPPLPPPPDVRPLPPAALAAAEGAGPAPGAAAAAHVDARAVLQWEGGEDAGLRRLRDWVWRQDALRRYFETRNGLVGEGYSSKLSPWLSCGCVSPATVYAEVCRYESERVRNKSTYWMVFELTARDYFRYYARHHGSAIYKLRGPKGVPTPCWSTDLKLFETWREGATGNPMVDANMRELLHTGYMSNRGRQIVASYLVRDMGLDWRLGAMWFESQLVDHDACANYGNWTYAAGVGSDPREDRYFSVPAQCRKYDPSFEHARLWCAEWRGRPDDEVQAALSVGTRPPPRRPMPPRRRRPAGGAPRGNGSGYKDRRAAAGPAAAADP